jgi:tetratricopeptide (TPR) repeat protein
MKRVWTSYLILLAGVVLFIGCNNNNGKTPATDNSNPVFQSEQGLKDATAQIESSPQNAALYYHRGNLLHKLKYDSLAIKDFKMATVLDSNNAGYYSAVGDLLFENKDIKGSVEWIQKALAKNPADKKARLKMAKMFLYLQDYPTALKEINNVLRVDVHNPEAYFLKGMVFKYTKDTARAISNFETSVQEDPEYHESIVQLGLLYSSRKDPVSLKYLDNAYRVDSTDVFPIFAKGVYYQNAGDFAEAKEEYKKCIMKDRHYVDAYFNMGYILLQQDSTQKAWRQYNLVTKIDPTNPTAYYNRGLCSEIMDSMKNAVDDYKMAATLDTGYKSPKEALKRLRGKK